MSDGVRSSGPDPASVARRRHWDRANPRGSHRDDADAAAMHGQAYAALDLGTNNCRLLVARPTGDSFRVVDAFSRIIRLGEGVSTSRILSEAAIERAVQALSVCRDKMKFRGVTRSRLIATEACRLADNCAEFLSRVRDEAGIDLEIVDRETEAELAATGCTPLIDFAAKTVILFDIGGGSSEVVRLGVSGDAAHRGPPHPAIESWVSLPLGVVTLAERHGGIEVTPESFEAMIGEVSAALSDFAAKNAGIASETLHLLGTSGTVTTIAGVHLDLPRYERRRVDGCWLAESEVDAVVARLLAMSYDERVASPCIGPERADLVLAGCAILEAIRRAFPAKRLRVADRGLREGMLVQMMRADGAWDKR